MKVFTAPGRVIYMGMIWMNLFVYDYDLISDLTRNLGV